MFTWNSTKANPGPNRTPSQDSPANRKRTVLIGTAVSVEQLHHILKCVEQPPFVVGCLLPAIAVNQAKVPLPILGSFDELGESIAHHVLEQALVSLPMAMAPQIAKLGQIGRAHV